MSKICRWRFFPLDSSVTVWELEGFSKHDKILTTIEIINLGDGWKKDVYHKRKCKWLESFYLKDKIYRNSLVLTIV